MRNPAASGPTTKTLKMRLCVLLSAAVLTSTAVGLGYWQVRSRVQQQIALGIRNRLAETISQDGDYRVQTSLSLRDALRGKVTSVTVSATDVSLGQGITVKRLTAALKGVRVDPVRKRLKGVDRADFSLSLTEDQLTALLARRYPSATFKIKLEEGFISVTASAVVRGKHVKARADVIPVARNGTQVVLMVRRVQTNTSVPPQEVQRFIENAINPLVDISKSKLRVRLTSVRITPAFATITGSGQLEILKLFSERGNYSSDSVSD